MMHARSRRAFLRDSLGLFALAPLARGAASEVAAEPAIISEKFEAIFSKTKVPGAAGLALIGDRIVAQGATGVRKKNAPEKITLGDKFHLGSCTKAMTATLAGMFVDEGKLTWMTPVGEIFSDVEGLVPAWKKVTFQQVLAHRAGLPPNVPPKLRDRLAGIVTPLPEQRREIVAELLSHPPESEPGSKFLYANNGYTLTGAALEKISGRAWEDLMRARLFEPLGITSGGFGAPGTLGKVDQPRGHRGPEAIPVEPNRFGDNIPAMGPAGTAHMTLGDWAKFIALHLRGDPSNPQRQVKLLGAESFKQLHRPVAGETYMGGWGTGARSWAKGSRPGSTGITLSHSGSNTMWFCVTWLAPEIDFAALVACNSAGEGAPAACDQAIGELIRGFAPKPAAAP